MEEKKFDYQTAQFEDIFCNLCGSSDFYMLARRSGNNLSQKVSLCRRCGLIYLNPRMTKEEYDNYYKYFYREDRAVAKGREIKERNYDRSFEVGSRFGRGLAQKLKSFIQNGLTIDVGSDTGGILNGIREVFPNMQLVGIEPSVSASEFANQKGIKTYNSLFEDFSDPLVAHAANIICTQTLNHFLDPRKFLVWSFKTLDVGGRLILVVKNFREQCRKGGSVESGVQIDHAYMFTPETLRSFVETIGFQVLYTDIDEHRTPQELAAQLERGLSKQHTYLVAEKRTDKGYFEPRVPKKNFYLRERIEFFQLYVKIQYFLLYAHRTKFLHSFFSFLRKW